MTISRMKIFSRFAAVSTVCSVILSAASCVNVNKTVGESFIPDSQKYNIYTATFDITDIEQAMADSLSGYSMYKFTFGALRDETFGLTTRKTAFTLVPVNDTLDFGTNAKFRQFHFSAVSDSTSFCDPSQEFILQNVNVYELDNAIDYNKLYPELSYTKTRITDGVPVYTGQDSLSFNFSRAFGEKYMGITVEDMDTMTTYTKKFPGIVISTDAPAGIGGRINMFRLPLAVSSGTIYGSYAELKITADYGTRENVDTSFIFYLGPLDLYDLSNVTSTSVSTYTQIAFDQTTHSSSELASKVKESTVIEGGRGIKPIIKAKALREKILDEICKHTDNPNSAVVSKATLLLPFEFPEDYTKMYEYPTAINPTCRIATDTSVTFASITDSSISDENQGDIDRSNCRYSPDVTHHIQELIKLSDQSKITNYDMWLFPIATETVASSSSSSSSSTDDYYQQLMYYNYYNNLYNGYGYGSYGYGYSNYYNNYYNYAMLQQMYSASSSSSSSSTTTTLTMMDFHRYYKAVLNGPEAEKNRPSFKIVYAIPKSE